jgi:hypothetical protein
MLQWYENGDAAKFLAEHRKEMDIPARSTLVRMLYHYIAGSH